MFYNFEAKEKDYDEDLEDEEVDDEEPEAWNDVEEDEESIKEE